MSFERWMEGAEPLGPEPVRDGTGPTERRRTISSQFLGIGTLACPTCDAPVSPGRGVVTPADPLGCGYCDHSGAVRDFLSLAAPSRPMRVTVRVVMRAGPGPRGAVGTRSRA